MLAWLDDRLLFTKEHWVEMLLTTWAAIAMGFFFTIAYGFAFVGFAHGQEYGNLRTESGVVCNTPLQVEQYLLAEGDSKTSLEQVNKTGTVCTDEHVQFVMGDLVKMIYTHKGTWHVTEIGVLAIGTSRGFKYLLKPEVLYTAFMEEEESIATLPSSILVVWKPEYAQNSPEVQRWYKDQKMNPAAKERLRVDWSSCCEHGDVFHTQFRIGKSTLENPYGADERWYLKPDGTWKQIPPDIIHWGEHAPDGRPTLFIYQSTGQELCFYPAEDGQ